MANDIKLRHMNTQAFQKDTPNTVNIQNMSGINCNVSCPIVITHNDIVKHSLHVLLPNLTSYWLSPVNKSLTDFT